MSPVETPGPGTDPLLRAHRAPSPRTLVDVLRATADDHPDSPAIDNGREVLTYDELLAAAGDVATALRDEGVGRGDRVGVRIPSGTTDLYVAIVGILLAGAAYVPVDHDDPDERASLVFNEAGVAAVVTADLVILSTEDAAESAPEEDPDLTDDELVERARQICDGLVDVTHAGAGIVELLPPGLSKSIGLSLVARRLGVKAAETIAFGDMPNDVTMLRWAGHGVAMANAHASVKAVADEVTASNNEDGVAAVLERIFPV